MKQNIYDNEKFFNGYSPFRSQAINYNNLLEQPCMKRLLPALHDKVVLDIGCGHGDFTAYCVEQGAKLAKGIDISSKMLTEARKRHVNENIIFEQIALEDYEVEQGKYDLVISSLALHYIADYEMIVRKVYEALAPGGILLFSMEHPMTTATILNSNQEMDQEGNLHYIVSHYQTEGKRITDWIVDNVVKYHRTIASTVNTLIQYGFTIEHIEEPQPSAEAIELMPKIARELNRPSFMIVRAKKSTRA